MKLPLPYQGKIGIGGQRATVAGGLTSFSMGICSQLDAAYFVGLGVELQLLRQWRLLVHQQKSSNYQTNIFST